MSSNDSLIEKLEAMRIRPNEGHTLSDEHRGFNIGLDAAIAAMGAGAREESQGDAAANIPHKMEGSSPLQTSEISDNSALIKLIEAEKGKFPTEKPGGSNTYVCMGLDIAVGVVRGYQEAAKAIENCRKALVLEGDGNTRQRIAVLIDSFNLFSDDPYVWADKIIEMLRPAEPDISDDVLGSKPDYHADPVEQLAFELAFELDEAKLNPDDYVTVNREKLRAIAKRAHDRLTAREPVSVDDWKDTHIRKLNKRCSEMYSAGLELVAHVEMENNLFRLREWAAEAKKRIWKAEGLYDVD